MPTALDALGAHEASEGIRSEFVEVAGLRVHYLEAGSGEPVILLHGWPTSSYLWRNVIPHLAARRRVIAPDLPGFGLSEKPVGASYSFPFYERVLDGLCERLGIERTGLAVHDLGGPIGLYWALRRPGRLSALALLNTFVYPEASWAVKLFVLATYTPGVRELLVSPFGIAAVMRLGVERRERLTPDVLACYQEPFRDREARRALLAAGHGLHPDGLREIAQKLRTIQAPVRIVYGENDRILPDVGKTMARVVRDLPQAHVTLLPGCGHFVQEDAPIAVGRALREGLG
jgi:haloalkane dehalogenase